MAEEKPVFTKDEIEEMKDIMLQYVARELPDVGFVIVNFETKEGEVPSESAYLEYLGSQLGIHFFEVSYDPKLEETEDNFKRMVGHELIHVMQYLRGDDFDFSLPYLEQPHEIEAYRREDEVVAHYESVIADNLTKGK